MFKNLYIAVAGNLRRPYSHKSLETSVITHGGEFSADEDVDEDNTHLVCGIVAYKSKIRKVKTAMGIKSIKIVDIDWVIDSIKEGKALPEEKYLFPECLTRNNPMGIEKAIEAKIMYKAELEWILTTPVHIYKDLEGMHYSTFLTRINPKESNNSSEIITFQILESKRPHQYVLSRGSGCFIGAIYGAYGENTLKELEVLTSTYNSELKKRELEGYPRLDLDNTIRSEALNAAPSEKTLADRSELYSLLEHISSPRISTQKLVAKTIRYDTLAIKNISKNTIEAGKKILRKLQNSFTKTKLTQNELPDKEYISKLISGYYNCIPHIFNSNTQMNRLDNIEGVNKELDMLNSLESIWASATLAKIINLGTNGHDDILRRRFESLKLKEITVVEVNSQEFQLIKRYFIKTGGLRQNPTWNLHIFRIEREGDEERWNAAGWDNSRDKNDNRRLLWHGTQMKSIHIILEQGLKDVRGIQGIYFSDTARTSLYYCSRTITTSPFAMFLCEVQLGHLKTVPGYSTSALYKSSGTIGAQNGKIEYKWVNARSVNQDLDGVLMPDVEKQDTVWVHVEWIARNPPQIKHRYLVVCEP